MIKIAVCDDDKLMLSQIAEKARIFTVEEKIVTEIKTYSNSVLLFYDIQENEHYDLLLLDIEMPQLNGLDLVQKVKSYLPKILIIFVTSYLKYTIDAFELSIFRYVPKNQLDTRFIPALSDAIKLIHLQSTEYLVIKNHTKIKKIPFNEISYIQRDGKNSIITTLNNETAKTRNTLNATYKQLNENDFIFIDRGCIINIAHVMEIRDCEVYLKNGKKLPLSYSRLNEIKKHITLFWGDQL